MPNDIELSREFLQLVLKEQGLSLQKLADQIGTTKGYLGQINTCKTPMSANIKESIIKVYPQYKDYDLGKLKVFSGVKKLTKATQMVEVTCYEENRLDNNFIHREKSLKQTLYIDKFFIDKNYTINQNSHFEVVRIANNMYEPIYRLNDMVLIDTGVKSFANGFIFVFVVNNDVYLRLVEKNGFNIRFIDINSRNNYFLVSEKELDKIKIIGMVVPKVRF